MEDTFREFFHIVIFVGDASPKEHARLFRVELTLEESHDFFCHTTSAGIDIHVGKPVPEVGVVVCFGCRKLQSAESSAVNIAFHLEYPAHELSVGCQHADAPARHIVAFRHRIELNAAFFCMRNLQD